MRPSNRDLVVDAAVALFADTGADAVTYDELAARTGLTKSGIVYHFSTRQLILEAVAARLIEGWTDAAERNLGGSDDRLAAFVAGMLEGDTTPAELQLAIETLRGRRMHHEWERIRSTWLQPDDASPEQFTAVAAALGLWLSEATGFLRLSDGERQGVVETIGRLATPRG
ncbi:MAG: helix-turn-helix domain containing protein [Microbacterium arborescens]